MESTLRPDGAAVIETFAWDGLGFVRLDAHLARAATTCARLGYAFERRAVELALAEAPAGAPARSRLLIGPDGPSVSFAPLPPKPEEWRVAIHRSRLDAADPWLRVKTTRRALYDSARAALPEGVDEYLFCNTDGALCEGTISNLFVRAGDRLLTPPVSAGLLPGILRAELLAAGRAQEASLTPARLAEGGFYMGNALRGLIPARLVQP